MRTITKIINPVDGKFGAPMGRCGVGVKPTDKKVFDCFVPMNGAYDIGGTYWGLAMDGNAPVRVAYTKDQSYIRYYRAFERKEG